MASNLSSIGFVFANEAEYETTMTRLINEAVVRLACDSGEYAIWRSRTGAEIWFHLIPREPGSDSLEAIGLTPFFEGESETAVHVQAFVRRAEDNSLEGLARGWIGPAGEPGQHGIAPIVFDCVDIGAHVDRPLPATWTARLTAFASAVRASPEANTAPLARHAFDAGETSDTVFSGTVLKHQALVNEDTGRPFHSLLVESGATRYDVVADPDVVTGEIVIGGLVAVDCQIFGRFLD